MNIDFNNSKLLFILIFINGCRIITPNDEAWNGYKNECSSKSFENVYWPIIYGKGRWFQSRLPAQYGYLISLNNDTLWGTIKYDAYGWNALVSLLTRKEGKLMNFYGNDFKRFRIFNDSANTIGCYTDFISLPQCYKHPIFWRLIGARNNAQIFDYYQFIVPWNRVKVRIPEMILQTKNDRINIYSSISFRSTKNSLKHFINHRYHKHFTKDYFKNEHAMIDYILDKENEKKEMDNAK